MEQPFTHMTTPPLPRELIDLAFRRARRRSIRASKRAPIELRVKVKEEARIASAGGIVVNRLRRILETTPRLASLHPFYRELADVLVGVDKMKRALAHVKWAEEMVIKLMRAYLKEAKRARDAGAAAKARRTFYGRLSSILKDLEESLIVLREASFKLRKLPSVNVEEMVVVVAGAPNVGKSSFIRCVSTAKPEVASYPFTTRKVLLGHLQWRGVKIQVMDTPGLLDRPIHQRNFAEKQAIAALRYLAKAVVFIIDPSETSGYSLEEQVNVYREVARELSAIPFILALNKVDLAREDQIKRAEEILGVSNVPKMVASRCEGVDVVLEEVLKQCRIEQSPWK